MGEGLPDRPTLNSAAISAQGPRPLRLLRPCPAPAMMRSATLPLVVMGASDAAGGIANAKWSTNCQDTNQWLATDVAEEALDALSELDKAGRTRIAACIYHKHMKGLVRNSTTYLLAAVRSELQKGPYAGAPQQAPGGPNSYKGPAPMGARQQQAPASPQQAPPPAPEWVLAAWQVHNKQAAFFRTLAQRLPPATMEKMRVMPGTMQYCCAIALLVSPANYQNPETFVDWFVSSYQGLPAVHNFAGSSASSSASDTGAKRLVVLSFGLSSATEWIGLFLAKEFLQASGVELVECISFASSCPWEPVLDECLAGIAGPTPVTVVKGSEQGPAMLIEKAAGWKQQQASVLVLLHIPQPVQSFASTTWKAPGYHAPRASEIWSTFHTIRGLGNFYPKVAVVSYQKPPQNPLDSSYWDGLFGVAVKGDVNQLRVPQAPWLLRCSPALQPAAESLTVRATGPAEHVQGLPKEFRLMFDPQTSFSTILPDIETLEDIFDQEAQQGLPPLSDKRLSVVLQTQSEGEAAGQRRLLSREQLGLVYGMSGWKYCDYWSRCLPCSGHINKVTGQPSLPFFPESVPCGATRWCPPCSHLYEALSSTISPFAIHQALTSTIGSMCRTPATAADGLFCISCLPAHACTQPCTGLAA